MSKKQNSALQLLRSPFKWLFYSNLANAIGVELRLMAQSWLILELGGSQVWVGAANGLRIIPSFLASLLAGLLIDRIGGRTILLWDRLGLLIIAAITAMIVLADVVQVWHVVALSIASGGVIALGMPSSNTLVTELVPREKLHTANSLNVFTFSIGLEQISRRNPLRPHPPHHQSHHAARLLAAPRLDDHADLAGSTHATASTSAAAALVG